MRRWHVIFITALLISILKAQVVWSAPVSVTYGSELPAEIKEEISARLTDEVTPESALHARRQARRARKLIQSILNSFGYFDSNIDMQVDVENGQPKPTLLVDAGAQFVVRRLVIRYEGEPPPEDDQLIAKQAMGLQPGAAAVAPRIIDVERKIGVALKDQGYPFAQVSGRDVIGDKAAKTISVRYTVAAGPRVQFGDVQYPDNIRTRKTYLRRINPIESGKIFNPDNLALYNARLSETRLFDKSLAKLSDQPSSILPDGTEIRDVDVQLDERDRHTLTLGAGYDTSEGFGVTAELLRRNLTRRGDLLVGDMTLSQREIGLGIIWRQPNLIGYGRGVNIFGSVKDENTDAFDQQTGRIGVGLEVIRSEKLQYGFGVDARYIRQTGDTVRRDFQVVSANAGISIDQSDSVLDPRRGWRAEGRLKPTYSFSPDGPDVPYIRAVAQGRAYLPLDKKSRYVLAGRLRLGTLVGAQPVNVPAEDRFFAGGGGSVRGYGFQAIGPFNAQDTPLGGRSLSELSVEGRARIRGNIGAAFFIDAGNVSDEPYPRLDNLRVGIGAGLRYQTPAGPIRLDVATPINPTERDQAIQVYISIGQAF